MKLPYCKDSWHLVTITDICRTYSMSKELSWVLKQKEKVCRSVKTSGGTILGAFPRYDYTIIPSQFIVQAQWEIITVVGVFLVCFFGFFWRHWILVQSAPWIALNDLGDNTTFLSQVFFGNYAHSLITLHDSTMYYTLEPALVIQWWARWAWSLALWKLLDRGRPCSGCIGLNKAEWSALRTDGMRLSAFYRWLCLGAGSLSSH